MALTPNYDEPHKIQQIANSVGICCWSAYEPEDVKVNRYHDEPGNRIQQMESFVGLCWTAQSLGGLG